VCCTGLAILAPGQESEAREELDVLLVLQERAVLTVGLKRTWRMGKIDNI
jgi:hypothetical protein